MIFILNLDFHKPKIHCLLDAVNENGIAEFLSGKIALKDAIIKHKLGFDAMVRGENTSEVVKVLTYY
jgi:Mrp family chromosome partitioning ATPase